MIKSEKNISSAKKSKFRNDVVLAAVIVIIAVAVLLLINATKVQGNSVVVKIDGEVTQSYSLSENVEFEIKTGKNNENINVVAIENGKVRVTEADCPDGICKEYRPISYVGQTIVCLPHKVVVEIVGENTKTDLDVAV
jgi:hypothetical protein